MANAVGSSPGQVMAELEELEREMAANQNDYEQAAYWADKLTKEWAKREATCALKAEGANSEKRKAHGFVMAVEMDDLFERYSEWTSRFNALRRGQEMRTARAMIKQSILKGQGRG
jgi:hypothetical protein